MEDKETITAAKLERQRDDESILEIFSACGELSEI